MLPIHPASRRIAHGLVIGGATGVARGLRMGQPFPTRKRRQDAATCENESRGLHINIGLTETDFHTIWPGKAATERPLILFGLFGGKIHKIRKFSFDRFVEHDYSPAVVGLGWRMRIDLGVVSNSTGAERDAVIVPLAID